jgi:hypothetical protein
MNSAIREKAGWFVRRLRSMPGSLQGFMWMGLILGPFATVASVLPGWMDEAGRPVSTIELWSMGAGPVCFAFGLGLIVWSGILLWYFFFKKSVVAYFTAPNMPEGRRADCL